MIDVKELLRTPINGIHSLGEYPTCNNLDELDADIAIIGVPHSINNHYWSGTRFGPKAIRKSPLLSSRSSGSDHEERDGMYLNPAWRIVDCGDIEVVQGDLEQTFKNIEETIEKIVSKGAIPVVLGGDHSITVPITKALKDTGSFHTVQIDAFLDFGDHRPDQKYGQGNPMRSLSEMDHVEGLSQLGIRGIGSSRKEDAEAARAYGSNILSLKKMRQIGIKEILNRIPDSERYYVTIDMDGLDLSVTPGTTLSDGLYYYEVYELLEGLVKKGEVIGFDFVQMDPTHDYTGNISQMAARITQDLIDLIMSEKDR